jgi:hypothetical protein
MNLDTDGTENANFITFESTHIIRELIVFEIATVKL